ncbi:Rne/Rng family ribonuclease [Nesterenkonia lutea]|uniref:Ribonuclease E n=1 Tax=Nesterenkonia lutea TaxID=272919 RepID=A0ABR9JD93_9MICC|nr:Rne/Rng family ribonuclease [Nesterenkonia lutea]MBE1523891.1 ribonuclease E [Nesterenkonia lutea]
MAHTETPADDTAGNNDIFNPFSPPPAPKSGPESSSEPAPESSKSPDAPVADPINVLFQAPDLATAQPRTSRRAGKDAESRSDSANRDSADEAQDDARRSGSQNRDSEDRDRQNRDPENRDPEDRDSQDRDPQGSDTEDEDGSGRRSRRKRRRGGRNKNRGSDSDSTESDSDSAEENTGQSSARTTEQNSGEEGSRRGSASKSSKQADASGDAGEPHDADDRESSASDDEGPVIRKRRRRRRGSADLEVESNEDDAHTVTRVRAPREAAEAPASNKVTGLKGSTRLEAKRQRRRSSRDTGRRRQVITEAEFLARRESVDRKMIVRQRGERIQIGVLEDGVLAEHYVSHTTQDSLIGNVYLGKVQNVLPSMEAAFVDIGRGRNAVLYAGEVDWAASRLGGGPRKIENALKSGDSVLVQVTKDPVGHKGARLTSQISLPGRYLVFVPGGSMTGISRKLPDTERARLKKVLKDHMPDNAGVIVRTAAEGASEEELTNDINRLRALWEQIQSQTGDKKVLAPELFYAEPDLTIKVVRDVFNEDFSSMEVQGEETWDNIEAYVTYVAPHLLDRLKQWLPEEHNSDDIFAEHRIDEQLNKALERKVNLPSGGSLVFDRTEAMTVVDVNTGKFTGSGGNLEETVTKNNLEAAEELVRQLRLRDIGGIIVIDFIDMVLEANRDLVLRRMVECLGRDRTKHQVAEVTSLGLVQMTRKRMGTGLLEVFSEDCQHCAGRGVVTQSEPVEHRGAYTSHGEQQNSKPAKKRRKGRSRRDDEPDSQQSTPEVDPQEKEKQEKARQALAQVAAATASKHAEEEEQSSPAESAPQQSRGSRRGRRSASQPAGGTGQATGEHSTAEVLRIGGEEVPLPRAEKNEAADAQPKAEAAEAKQVSLDTLGQALDSREPRTPAKPARRRRRAAGSVQGASGEVQQIAAPEKPTSTSFSSAAAEKPSEKAQPKAPASEPVMLGVGVKAEEIARPE